MKKVIAAIDFGTSGTTYAFAFSDGRENIITGNWEIPQTKNSTEIILDENLNIKKFGVECKKYLGDKSSSDEKYYHFKDIKMLLYHDKTKIAASNDKSMVVPITTVISKILIKIKEVAINHIKSQKPSIKESEIKWKVTVPAIWKNKSKEIMIKSSKLAKIFNTNEEIGLFFALEPEAAACNYVFDNSSDKDSIKLGNKYIVCDIGGGTVDISTHQRIKNNEKIYIEEVYPPIGGNNGSTYINQMFMSKVISKLFGSTAIEKLTNIINNPYNNLEIYEDYCEFLDSIEKFKIDISYEEKDEFKRINCSLFEKLIQEDIDTLIKEYNKTCPYNWRIKNNQNNNYKIYFPYKIMIDLTKEIIVDKVVGYLKQILEDVQDVKSIIYAGSVSTNDYIISMIKKELPDYLNHCVSSYPSTAVVTGAVLFGFDPYIVESRLSKYTIGIKCSENWDEIKYGLRKEKKYFDKEYNCYRCRDCFSSIIEKGQKIKANIPILKHYEILFSNTTVQFYKTKFNNVTFVDEKQFIFTPKCLKFGELQFNVGNKFDKNDRDLIVELKLGGTFIQATITYKDIKKEAPFDFTNEE